jgi:hypothetical protein
VRLCSAITYWEINVLLQPLSREDLFNVVAEVAPPHVAALLRCLVVFAELLELGGRKHYLAHVEADTELGVCDMAGA